MSGTTISAYPEQPRPTRRAVLGGLAAIAALPVLPAADLIAAATAAATDRRIAETFWRGAGLAAGTGSGTVLTPTGLQLRAPVMRWSYTDPYRPAGAVAYDAAMWVGSVVTPGFAWTELVASWNADTPPGTWIEVAVRGVAAAGTPTPWFTLARWCADDVAGGGAITRTSVSGQAIAGARLATDTLQVSDPSAFAGWQLRVVLLRRAGTSVTPTLRLAGAVASAVPASGSTSEPTSVFGGTVATLAVPSYSQERHAGHYPAWGGGGESWCSATTTAMLLDYWGAGPTTADLAWVSPAADAQVDLAARQTFDTAYDGTGNWPFNTAYAATRGAAGVPLEGYVTRLRDLAAAEPFIRAGVPLGVSLSFTATQLTGAGYGTDGHLMVLVGFDPAGDPVVNDPASHLIADNARVRTIYRRDQFERAWANSGRTAYVVRPSSMAAGPSPAPRSAGPSVPITPVPAPGRTLPRRP